MDTFSRRRLLQVGGTGTALTLAGCSSLSDDPEDEESQADPNGDGSDRTSTVEQQVVTVVADLDGAELDEIEAELEERQQEIQQQVEDGEIDDEEAQVRFQEAQTEAQQAQTDLLESAIESLEEHIGDTDDVSVSDSAAEAGVLLVEGAAEPIIGLLTLEDAGGLLAEDQFEELQQPGF